MRRPNLPNQQPTSNHMGPLHDSRGFTLLETLMVMVVLSVVLSLAVPSIRDFINRNRAATLANEFSAAMTAARMEAITSNTCVTICQSANAAADGPSCANNGDDNWQRGWIIFKNPTCDAAKDNPAEMPGAEVVRVRQSVDESYTLSRTGNAGTRWKVMFDGRGMSGLSGVMGYLLTRQPEGSNYAYARHICISQGGRITIRKYEGGDCSL